MDRRDSKKSGRRQKDKSKSEEGEDDRKGKSSGLVRTKMERFPCREIYRPPSMRKQRTNSTGSNHDSSNHNNFNNTGNNHNCSVSPIARPGNASNGSSRPFNVHAKEFQYSQLHHHHHNQQHQQSHLNYNQQQQQQQQPSFFPSNRHNNHYSSGGGGGDYFGGNGMKSSPILASSGCYPLQQSKSSGNVNNFYQLWHQQQHQDSSSSSAAADMQALSKQQPLQRNQSGILVDSTKSAESNDDIYRHHRHVPIQQSKSSGNIISLRQSSSSDNGMRNGAGLRHSGSSNGPKTVRFDFQDQRPTPITTTTTTTTINVEDNNNKINHNDFQREFSAVTASPVGPVMENRFSRMKRDLDFTEQSFASLQIDGEAQPIVRPGGSGSHQHHIQLGEDGSKSMGNAVISSPQLNSKFRHQMLTNSSSSQPPPPQLQKSRTTFYMDANSSSSPYNNNGRNNYDIIDQSSTKDVRSNNNNNGSNLIRRSKSFGIVPRSNSNTNMNMLMSQSSSSFVPPPPLSSAELAASPDFDLSIWPKSVQESIVAVMTTSAERVPVRIRIEMVTKIYSVILREYDKENVYGGKESIKSEHKSHLLSNDDDDDADDDSPSNNSQASSSTNPTGPVTDKECGESPNQDHKSNGDSHRVAVTHPINSTDLISSAVNIFLYLIQREKDRTIMESVLNTCFATFQRLQRLSNKISSKSQENFRVDRTHLSSGDQVTTKWITFLQFLSAMYTKIKVFRLQKSQQPGMKGMEELNFTLLALLCDSCLVSLRCPVFQTSETMDPLFNIMTSIGRDMEMLFPMKMKQILAAVRDALLGIRPFSMAAETPSPNVQRTLMQLIELHAANWSLSSSAVRYYYSNPG